MQRAIVIATHPDREEYLTNLLESLHGYIDYPIITLSMEGYEPGKIRWVLDNTNLDEFFFLQDSIEVKDPLIFRIAFEQYRGKTFSIDQTMRSFLVKYRREPLLHLNIKPAKTKLEAVEYEDYILHNYPEFFEYLGKFNKSNVFEEKFGRTNMVLENKYLKKYKATWSRSQLC